MKITQSLLALSVLSACGFGLATDSSETAPRAAQLSARAAPSRAYIHSYNLPGHGVAIEGYSPVSYFDGVAERGSPLFAVEHDGVTYHLASTAQVQKFQQNPARYVPAYGGWCAFGMSVSDKFPVDPTCFDIVDGRVMLFLRNDGVDALELWRRGDERDLVTKANAHWKKVQG